jgi:ribosomal protein L7/L12
MDNINIDYNTWKKIVYRVASDNPSIIANVIDEILGDKISSDSDKDKIENEMLTILGTSPTCRKIDAVKKYRELTKLSLYDSKTAVEDIMLRHNIIVK